MLSQQNECDHELIPILYGYPPEAYREWTSQGKAFHGGCMPFYLVDGTSAQSRCKKCYKDFSERVDLDW